MPFTPDLQNQRICRQCRKALSAHTLDDLVDCEDKFDYELRRAEKRKSLEEKLGTFN